MHAHAIPQVESSSTGIHLIWIGPRPWLYSPGGWSIQRRVFQREDRVDCDNLGAGDLSLVRVFVEMERRLGVLLYRQGAFPTPLASPAADPGLPAEVLTYTLNEPQPFVRVNVQAGSSFALARRAGKAVAVSGAPVAGSAFYELRAVDIEDVVVYAIKPESVRFCVPHRFEQEDEWRDVPFIVKELQLPLQELMPGLNSPDDEFNAAAARVPANTNLDPDEFARLADTLRVGAKRAGPPRPIDQVLLLREDTGAEFEELVALDPLRVMMIHPMWRRALGFGFFDQDPALVAGETYEYRITGHFPAEDLADEVYGFHTIPSQTLLPAEFYLHDVHVLLPQPARVELSPDTVLDGLRQITRRGIRLLPRDQHFWELPVPFDEWSLIFDLPQPVQALILELHPDHALEFQWKAGDGSLGGPKPVPPGPRPRLEFPEPVRHVRLSGKGFLFAVRLPRGPAGPQPVSIVLPPVTLVDSPRPDPPLSARLRNLQQPPTSGSLSLAGPPSRQPLGFQVNWRPAPQPGVSVWPADESAAPPIEGALYQIEHRQVFLAPDEVTIIDATDWQPVLPDENWVLGDRDEAIRSIPIRPGVDLMQVYPEEARRSPAAGLDVLYRDVFDFEDGGGTIVRPVPPPGTFHQYRVRAVDAIGRASPGRTETNVLRLEKRVPPPVPVGPRAPQAPALPTPQGVQARVLVRDAPDLTPEDRATLGGDDNAIVLAWGWHQEQRDQDTFAREFRVYLADKPLDTVPGEVASVTPISPGVYDVTLSLERSVEADAARHLQLRAGYPFFIAGHSAGSAIAARLEARVPDGAGNLPQPALGPVQLPLRVAPSVARPPAWSERVETQPITAAATYRTVLRNRLALSAGRARDAIWVGVSAADDQDYVADQLAPADNRPGNESAIVSVLCQARFYGRPDFEVPPALDPVPVLVAPEPAGRPVFFDLDLRPGLAGSGLGAADLFRPERLSADSIAAAYFLSPANAVMARAVQPRDGETDLEVAIPNPADRAAVIAALQDGRTTALDGRFLVFLAGSHPYRDRLFEPATQDPVLLGPFPETLPPKAGRYVYRVRRANAAGNLSAGGAMARLVVRVPSLAPGQPPDRLTFVPGDPPGRLRLRLPAEAELTHVLTFSQPVAPGDGAGRPVEPAFILRTPNRPDLYPDGGLWLRTPEGALLVPGVKALSDADVTLDSDGLRRLALDFAAAPGQRVRVWACSLTRDGIPSAVAGPWTLAMPLGPLPEPVLAASIAAGRLRFTWTWPPGPAFEVALERSADGVIWRRISPRLDRTAAAHDIPRSAAAAHYRLRVYSLDGRSAHSNALTI